MSELGAVSKVTRALEAIAQGLRELEAAGAGIPAVEKNAVRMKGALRQLEVQFADLAAVIPPEPP